MILLPLPLAAVNLTDILQYPLITFGDESALTVLILLKIILSIVGVFAANFLLRRLVVLRILERTKFDSGLRFAVTKIFSYGFVTLGLYLALVINGVNLTSLTVVGGALGLGVGFGLQNIVANFVSGLVLLAERPVAVGDRIEVAGAAGVVTQINLRSTTVVTNDNISIIVPNSNLTSQTVTNWSHGDPKVRVRLPIGVAYGSPIEKLTSVLLGVADADPHVLKDPPPTLFFAGFGDSSLNFELGVWTREMLRNPRRFRSDLNFAVERALRENGIEIPFPQRVVHMRSKD